MVGTHTNLLVGVEGNADISVTDVLMVTQIAHGLYNLCDTGLVVGTQQGVSVSHNQVLASVVQQFREFLRTADDTFRELDLTTIVVADDLWLDVGSAAIRTSVVVGDEADGRHLLLDIRGKGRIEITLLVEFHVFQSFAFEFFFQVLGKDQLFRGTWHTLAVLSRLRVELGVV